MLFRLWLHKCTLTVPYINLTTWCFISIFPLNGFCHLLRKCRCNIWRKRSQNLHLHWRVAPRRRHLPPVLAPAIQPPCWSPRVNGKKSQQLPFSDVEKPSLGFTPTRKERRRTWREVTGIVHRYHHSPENHRLLSLLFGWTLSIHHPSIHEAVKIWCWMECHLSARERVRTCAGGWEPIRYGGTQLYAQLWLWIFTPG